MNKTDLITSALLLLHRADKRRAARAVEYVEDVKGSRNGAVLIAKVSDYDVNINLRDRRFSCTCQDYANRKVVCKHGIAVATKWLATDDAR